MSNRRGRLDRDAADGGGAGAGSEGRDAPGLDLRVGHRLELGRHQLGGLVRLGLGFGLGLGVGLGLGLGLGFGQVGG